MNDLEKFSAMLDRDAVGQFKRSVDALINKGDEVSRIEVISRVAHTAHLEERPLKMRLHAICSAFYSVIGEKPDPAWSMSPAYSMLIQRGRDQRTRAFLRSAVSLARARARWQDLNLPSACAAYHLIEDIRHPDFIRYHCLPKDRVVSVIDDLIGLWPTVQDLARQGFQCEARDLLDQFEKKHGLA